MGVEAFGIEKEFLRDLLTQVDKGETQLPEFQRGWVWPDRNIASLIASITLGYPAGGAIDVDEPECGVKVVTGPADGSEDVAEQLSVRGKGRVCGARPSTTSSAIRPVM